MIKKIRKAVFPVAGLGTRFLPATKAMPKEMLPIVDKPLIQYAVEEAIEAGIKEIIFVTGKGKTALEDHFDRSHELEYTLKKNNKKELIPGIANILPPDIRVTYTRQSEPLGLGHAVGCAASIVGNEPFAVLLADDVYLSKKGCLKQIIEAYEEVGGNLVAAMEVPKKHTSRYGIITPGEIRGTLTAIKGLVEKPSPETAPSRLAISGRYILQPEIFQYLSLNRKGAGGEIQLTDAMEKLMISQPFHGIKIDGERFDCGSKFGWLRANIIFALENQHLSKELKILMRDIVNKQE
jgi:UTP--glucose-1-phosphate uridylyltransferase